MMRWCLAAFATLVLAGCMDGRFPWTRPNEMTHTGMNALNEGYEIAIDPKAPEKEPEKPKTPAVQPVERSPLTWTMEDLMNGP
jgi:hypothetical protein